MKNIIWQMPNGRIAVRNLSDDKDSQAEAAALIASGTIAEDWTAVLFDVQEFPGPPQECWRLVDGALVADPASVPVLSKDQQIAKLLAVRGLTLDSEWQLYAAIAGMQAAASTQGKTEAQLYASNPGYKNAKDLFLAVAAIRASA